MKTIYFDNSATTRPCEEAIAAMHSALSETWGNPSSLHRVGLEAENRLKEARGQVLRAIGEPNAKPENLIFTAGGTEADNLAILGTAQSKRSHRSGQLIISDSEHPAILQPVKWLEEQGYRVVRIATKDGVFDFGQYLAALTPDTFLVSCMLVNNETGAVNDIPAIAAAARRINPNVVIHTDAVQGFLKMPLSVRSLGADLITLSAHKIHGPKGVGALYVSPAVCKAKRLCATVLGGGQEGGLRSGTENLPGIAGFGAAAMAGHRALCDNIQKMRDIRAYLTEQLAARPALAEIVLNQPKSAQTAPHILNIRLPRIKSNTMLNYLSAQGICVSSGSACAATSGKVSQTLLQFGLSNDEADASIRISLSHENTKEEADILLDALALGVSSLVRFK